MSIRNFRQISTSFDDGKWWKSFIHKTSGLTSSENPSWLDLSMMAGTPKYNAYVGSQTEATLLPSGGNNGIYVPAPDCYINSLSIETAQAQGFFILQDYLLAYPLVDGDSTDQQDMTNNVTLPRYTDGAGVQCMLVCTTPMAADGNITVSYTNQSGVSGRTTTFGVRASANTGNIICGTDTSAGAGKKSPYIPLADGDYGIRKIDSITNLGSLGGFFAAVLVKPLVEIQTRESAVPSEVFLHQLGLKYPQVKTGAYLNYIVLIPASGALNVVLGNVEFFW